MDSEKPQASNLVETGGPLRLTPPSSRPMPSTSIGDIPIRLTPISARVSRARKGVPVHTCEICTKTFTRAEHLRRHQLSHEAPGFPCTWPGCDKTFHRESVLAQHMQRHEEDVERIRTASSSHLPGETTSPNYQSLDDLRPLHIQFEDSSTYGAWATDHVPHHIQPFPDAMDHPAEDSFGLDTSFCSLPPVFPTLQAPSESITDSGYASRTGPLRTRVMNNMRTRVPDDDVVVNQAKYSDTLSLPNTKLATCISEIAEEIASALPRSISARQLSGLSTVLPELLKVFSLKLSRDESRKVHMRLMYFMNKYRTQIADAVVKTFAYEYDDGENGVYISMQTDSMVIADNKSLWQRMENDLSFNTTEPVLPGESAELNEEFDDLPELHEYRDVLLQSPAFSWLLESASKELRLEIPGDTLDMRWRIRSTVLNLLGKPARPSRKAASTTYSALCRLKWIKTFMDSQEFGIAACDALDNVLVLVGTYSHAWVTTCRQYARAVWPEVGPEVLDVYKALLQINFGTAYKRVLSDEARISGMVWEDGSRVEVAVTGTSYSIAEVCEVLVWLDGALQSNFCAGTIAYTSYGLHVMAREVRSGKETTTGDSMPSGTQSDAKSSFFVSDWALEQDFRQHLDQSRGLHSTHSTTHDKSRDFLISHNGSPEFQLECNIWCGMASRKTIPQRLHEDGQCWIDLFDSPVLVRSFPIPHREERGGGIEVTLDILLKLANSRKVSVFGGKFVIKGFSTILIPSRRYHGCLYWHMITNEYGKYLSYTDSRSKKLFQQYPENLNIADLETSRHIVGWCANANNCAGTRMADYNISWSGLQRPPAGCAFEKVSIVGGMYVTAGVSCILGKKDKAVHIQRRDDYIMRLKWISKKFVVLYDVRDRRAWLVDGVTALLHLVRASLKHDQKDEFKDLFLFDESALQEAPLPGMGKSASIAVLTNKQNTSLPLYAKPERAKEEFMINEAGAISSILSKTRTNYSLQERTEDICDVLEQIIAHQADVSTEDGVGFRLKTTLRRQLEGFDFMDVATDEDPIWPRLTTLKATGKGWVDFIRAINAVTLFGSGFGELIRPIAGAENACGSCQLNLEVPKGQDYLAVCVPEIQEILEKRGSKNTNPWRLVDDIYWHTPDKTFEECKCRSTIFAKHDRVQVLLPSSFPKMWKRGFKSPRNLSLTPRGALLFGHSQRFPLRWRDRGDPEERHPEKDELEEMDGLFHDSGLGTSLGTGSSAGGIDGNSPQPSVSSHPEASESDTRRSMGAQDEDEESLPRRRRSVSQSSSTLATAVATNYQCGTPEPTQGRRFQSTVDHIIDVIAKWKDKNKDVGPMDYCYEISRDMIEE